MCLLVRYEVRVGHFHRIDALSRDVRVLVVAVVELPVILSIVQFLIVYLFRYSVIYALIDNRRHEPRYEGYVYNGEGRPLPEQQRGLPRRSYPERRQYRPERGGSQKLIPLAPTVLYANKYRGRF